MPEKRTMLSDGVTKRNLENGLTVLIKENHSAPVVSIVTNVKAGYFNESDGVVGISHLMEHMFFKGTKKRKVGDIARETKTLGGYLNASTIYDHTLYYTVLPSENFSQGLDIQSDALINSVIDPGELKKETEVVIQEAKRKLDIPSAVASEKMYELAFDKHRIRRWRIGTEDGLRALTREDLLTFHKNLYRPENITLTVVGDINTTKTLEEIEKHYKDFERGILLKEESSPEPAQQRFKYRQVRGDIQQSYFAIGFHTPEILNQYTYAIDILAFILGHGRSSRLYQKVREESKLVNTISASNYALPDVGIFEIEATGESKNFRQAELAIFEEIEKMRQKPAQDEELIKARNSLEAMYVFSLESVSGQANMLTAYEALGDYRLAEEYLDKLCQVTQDDIVQVAQQYLTLSNCSLLEYVPNSSDLQSSNTGDMEQVIKKISSLKASDFVSFVKGSETQSEIFTIIPSTDNGTDISRYVLANGMTLLIKEDHQIPLVSTAIYAKGGRAEESSENNGISGLTIRTSLKGTHKRSGSEIASQIEKLGTTIHSSNDPDYFGYSMCILSKYFEEGWKILADIITNPTFPDDEVAKEKKYALAQILRQKDDMFRYPLELLYAALFKNHPYGLSALGKPELIKNYTRQELQSWHLHYFTPKNMVATFVGDIETHQIIQFLEKSFSEQEVVGQKLFKSPNLDEPSKIIENSEQRDKEQTAMALGFVGPKYTENDFYPLLVLQNIISGLGGRFFEELRGRQSLAYTVAVFIVARACGGAVVSYIASSPENEELAKNGLLNEFDKLTKEVVTENELKQSIQYTLGTYQIGLETYRAQMVQYLHNEILGKGIEEIVNFSSKIKQVTREELLKVARKYFDPNRFAVGIVRGRIRN